MSVAADDYTIIEMMKPFNYYAPGTLKEAVDILADGDERMYPLAGGTSLFYRIRLGEIPAPTAVVNLKGLSGLADIRLHEDGSVTIGPLVTLNRILVSSELSTHFPILPQTARVMASRLIRNLGTIGGNVCRAVHFADLVAPLMVLGAEIEIMGPEGERRVPLQTFYPEPGTTALARGEVVTGIRLPPSDEQTHGAYLNYMHREMVDLTVAGVAVSIRLDPESRECRKARIAFNAVTPVQHRIREAETMLNGTMLTDEVIAEAARVASEAVEPIDDHHASSWYRRELLCVLTRRALQQTAGI